MPLKFISTATKEVNFLPSQFVCHPQETKTKIEKAFVVTCFNNIKGMSHYVWKFSSISLCNGGGLARGRGTLVY